MSVNEIARGVYAISGLKTGRCYIVEGDDGLALIDTSTADATTRIVAAVASIGRRPDDIKTIVGTHYHFDHVGNVGKLVEMSGAEFCVHESDVPYVEGRTPWRPATSPIGGVVDRFAPKQFSLKVDRVLRDGDSLPFGGGLQVIHAPGHTPGHIALYAKERRALFAGDSLMNIAGLRLPIAMSSHDMKQARASIRKLAALDFDVALPGHGRPIIGHASEKIAEWSKKWL